MFRLFYCISVLSNTKYLNTILLDYVNELWFIFNQTEIHMRLVISWAFLCRIDLHLQITVIPFFAYQRKILQFFLLSRKWPWTFWTKIHSWLQMLAKRHKAWTINGFSSFIGIFFVKEFDWLLHLAQGQSNKSEIIYFLTDTRKGVETLGEKGL